MKINDFGNLVCSIEDYDVLKKFLNEYGVAFEWASTDGKIVTAYARNPYKEAVNIVGDERVKECANEGLRFYDMEEVAE